MAVNILELRKDIQTILKNICENVFYRRSSDTTKYPYIVYSIKSIGEAKELEINIWDYNCDTSKIENIADKIEDINREIVSNENHTFSLWNNYDRQWIDDDNKDILRINMTFELRYFEKE